MGQAPNKGPLITGEVVGRSNLANGKLSL